MNTAHEDLWAMNRNLLLVRGNISKNRLYVKKITEFFIQDPCAPTFDAARFGIKFSFQGIFDGNQGLEMGSAQLSPQ